MFAIASLLVLFSIALAACGSPAPAIATATPKAPESIVKLVENGDDVKNIYTTSHGFEGYDDVSLEQGMVAAQVMCKVQKSISAGSASTLNTSPLSLEDCPELATGVKMQIVNTQTAYSFECQNCNVTFDGTWEYGDGVRVWRGTVRITRTNDKEPVLNLVPLSQP